MWLSPLEGSRVMQRLDGYSVTRPNTHDLLLEFIEMAGGVVHLKQQLRRARRYGLG